MSVATQPQGPTQPTGPSTDRADRDPITVAGDVWRAVHDPRYVWWQRLALVLSALLVVVAVERIPGMDWPQRLEHAWYHLWVVAWFLFVTYRLRSVGSREVVRFWVTGFFPVSLLAFVLSEPLEGVFSGNLQTALRVPVIEELVKVAPLLLVTLLLRPKHRHSTLTDFWLLGFALGAGFSFHEDALYVRLASSGFADGLDGVLFPTYLRGGQYVVTHGGWTALAAFGVGVFALYRRRVWAWVVAAFFVAVPILDHAAVNWRGDNADLVRGLALDGELASSLLLLSVLLAIGHDVWMLWWANSRDELFPQPLVRDDLRALRSGRLDRRLGLLAWRQRYRRFRNAAFCDLYRVRSTGATAGDRREVIGHLRRFEQLAEAGTAHDQD